MSLALAVAGLTFLSARDVLAQEEGQATLEKQVRNLRDRSLWDSALGATRKYTEDHPSEAEDARVKRLLTATKELAQEADTLFQKDMGEAEKQLKEGKYGQALTTASQALRWYPERTAAVTELHNRVLKLKAGQDLIRVAAGTYRLGSDLPEDENPRREVTLKSFVIDKYPVTNEDYAGFISATGHAPPAFWVNSKPPKGRERHPVVCVTWMDAGAYARWVGKRLPSAEEWEAAATGSDGRDFPWGAWTAGKDDPIPCNCLEYWQVHKTESPGTMPVDFFEKQRRGGAEVPVMGANVWEWTATSAPGKVGDTPREFRVLKGGSFMTTIKAARCANSYAENPRLAHPDVGFRCAKDAD
jgi:formylglycine-generating enzyme required for sulfatase activity